MAQMLTAKQVAEVKGCSPRYIKKIIQDGKLKAVETVNSKNRKTYLVPLDALDEEALVRILREPKNALIKQYKKLFEMDNIQIDFEEDALRAIAKKAIERKTGARGLRGIMEELLGNLMFEAPSDGTVAHIVITADMVNGLGDAMIMRDPMKQPTRLQLHLPGTPAQKRRRGAVS